MGIKKKYGIFNESAQKVEKIAKNKVERELVDTLYLLDQHEEEGKKSCLKTLN